MITVSGMPIHMDIIEQYHPSGIEGKTVRILQASSSVYNYGSLEQLDFELKLRRSTVEASRALNNSGLYFRVFRDVFCNPEYWSRTDEGGFLTKEGVSPYHAVKDIFVNGASYGTECATAIVIVFYGAVLDFFPEALFNRIYRRIYLMNWQHLDSSLGIMQIREPNDYFPGDCRYFKNPDVDPATPEWQGENAIDLGNGLYYGHGMGIRPAERIIDALNSKRILGSTTSAYLMLQATRLNARQLWRLYNSLQ
ncbi:MAG: protein-glutamine gamma-glutamyltransferase [Clostridia bacterium]|nr:protein-glutamine gamma-glutamyltransferase [Clostridia bacterium]